jgi:hypothetical protein
MVEAEQTGRGNQMPKYEVLFAQDVPHYGLVEIEARNDKAAVGKAKAHWRSIERGDEPWPLTEPGHDSAILARVVYITDEKGREVATDISLDKTYRLVNTRAKDGAA